MPCTLRIGFYILLPATLLTFIGGCGFNLPSTVVVELPDGTTVEVEEGAGAPSLANTTWDLAYASGAAQGSVFVTVIFDEDGALTRFDNNTIAVEFFGETIYFDGERHATSQPGISYEAAAFGAETAEGGSVAFEGRMTAFAAGAVVGSARVSVDGTFDSDDPNIMRGTFSLTTESDLIPEVNSAASFSFVAQKRGNEETLKHQTDNSRQSHDTQ